MTDSLKAREEVEWLNFWYDDANSESGRRVLFFGDSLTPTSARAVATNMSAVTFAVYLGRMM